MRSAAWVRTRLVRCVPKSPNFFTIVSDAVPQDSFHHLFHGWIESPPGHEVCDTQVEVCRPRLEPKAEGSQLGFIGVDRRSSAANMFSSRPSAKITTKYGSQMNADERR
jgi:hypothetical protein